MEKEVKNNFILKDECGDRKYFTQIPNMIVNHSSAYEQSLYLIMKRIAGEDGSCYASLNFLASNMEVHKTTVSKTITKLLKRKWIAEIGKTKVKGGYTRTFVIIDLWKINLKNYKRSGAELTTYQGGASVDGGGAVVDGGGAQSDTKKNLTNIKKKKHFSFKKKEIRYYAGNQMRQTKVDGKWWVLTDDGEWREFNDKLEKTYFK